MKAIEQAIKETDVLEVIMAHECPSMYGVKVPELCNNVPTRAGRKDICKKCWNQEVE